ncbi:hypothetical protein [Oceanobacillus neutriphilus]|uniref:Uncharacterized protein n=1 Tax=Oceanobacillus neutriphilus TaxID=531815 RepID=A0ABQ2NW47_9BACI|nr:hypothetical protein [Oceanobacillus neutriphilus]GGP12057.1 hypothetical protein GCM10011346_26530 [Oceanobacillus neutriphilus]
MKKLLIAVLVVFSLFSVTMTVSAAEPEYPDSTHSLNPNDDF